MITTYEERYKQGIIDLVLGVQNDEYKLGISIEEQGDILDIPNCYLKAGGGFWIAVDQKDRVIGSIGLMKKTNEVFILKKFFVYSEYRGKEPGIGKALFEILIEFAKQQGGRTVLLDTPSSADRSHQFYRKNGFKEITTAELPVTYEYPDRNSLLFRLDLS
ncbi:GNAT family N-acetyltransferase [Paenibacillus sp. NPDC058177]|uniref:GNAT family N-acetyltransferase n=1 Tax=Paenibacillus sp. NPDC058177 TaxID=3346369 RepID=UPI0036D955CA